MFKLHGVYAPIPTPFSGREEAIDYGKLESNMPFWLGSDLEGLVVLGSNGEFVSLSFAEKIELVTAVCQMAAGKKYVVAGCGCDNTRDTIVLCEKAAQAGANAALIISPNYFKKSANTAEVQKAFYTEVADHSPIPVILYNMPGNSGVNLTAGVVSALSAHKNIIGVKDSGGNIVQISEILRDASSDFSVFAGSASFLLPTLVMGGAGGTLALANIMPNQCARVQKLYDGGKLDEAVALQKKLIAINMAVTAQYGIAGLKAACDHLGLYGGAPRKPMLPISPEGAKAVCGILDKAMQETARRGNE